MIAVPEDWMQEALRVCEEISPQGWSKLTDQVKERRARRLIAVTLTKRLEHACDGCCPEARLFLGVMFQSIYDLLLLRSDDHYHMTARAYLTGENCRQDCQALGLDRAYMQRTLAWLFSNTG